MPRCPLPHLSGTNKYARGSSSAYTAIGTPFVIEYADGDTVNGVLSQDRLDWGGLAVPNQVFAEISDAESFSIVCVEDGLLGMSFDELASSEQVIGQNTVWKRDGAVVSSVHDSCFFPVRED